MDWEPQPPTERIAMAVEIPSGPWVHTKISLSVTSSSIVGAGIKRLNKECDRDLPRPHSQHRHGCFTRSDHMSLPTPFSMIWRRLDVYRT